MEKPFYKCIVLVLASDNTPLYRYFKKAYESYLESNPNIKVFFTYAGKVDFEPKEYDLIFPNIKESYQTPFMAMKTVKALEYIDKHYDYDYIVRTNLSTFWRFDKLLDCLSELPTSNCIAGRPGIFGPLYITGISMFISKDLVKSIVENESVAIYQFPKYIPEDKMICDYFTEKYGAEAMEFDVIQDIEHLTVTDLSEINKYIDKGDTRQKAGYRIKNLSNRDLIDTTVVRQLCLKFYGIDIGDYDANV